ncbi:MAG TPA: hypothetical protein VMU82_01930, partial [Acetobacteraceae bacterium]|nr:hypothetical protein [Acetobacteraceae bacterium]
MLAAPMQTLAMLLLILGVPARAAGVSALAWPLRAALVAYLAASARFWPRTGWVMAGVFATLAAVGLWLDAAPVAATLGGLDRSAVFAAFFGALSFLRAAANGSARMRRCGAHLVRQPPGRRYAALALGGFVYGIILNIGVVDLLGGMVQAANADQPADPAVAAFRLRRMLVAVQRGFSATSGWQPLSIMMTFVLTALPMLRWQRVVPMGLGFSTLLLILGWSLDRASGLRAASRPAELPPPPAGE